ncbi:MAG: YncE family protein [Candidatus Riflebacteria bacterium]|nr:YncE family protein [Candidatus Riflebacteria bacterium]
MKRVSIFLGWILILPFLVITWTLNAEPISTSPSKAQNCPEYKVVNRISVEGDGFWDLATVDETTGKLYLSHGSIVQVVDTKSGKLAGYIPDTNVVHGIAIANDFNKGFITCGKDSKVVIFDLKSLKILAKIPSGKGPDGILYDPFSRKVFAFNGKSADVTVIDAKKNTVVVTLKLGGKPELPVSDDNGTIFVNIQDKNMIETINVKTLKVEQKWPIIPGEEPTGLAIDKANHRLFIGCNNKLMVIMDSLNGKFISSVPVGAYVDGAGFDPGTRCAFTSNGDGTLTVVQEESKDKFRVLENVVTQKGARTLAVDTKTHHIFLPTAVFGPPPQRPNLRPFVQHGTFVVLDVAPGE